MRTSDRSARGFTLLEMLVVLLIAGLALVLTTQALGQYQRAHTRAIASERAGREQRTSEAWFRDSVRGLQALAPAPGTTVPDAFEGDARGFHGTTLSPVLQGQGVPTQQRWRIESRAGVDRLALDEDGQAIELALPRARALRLQYLDAEGKLHDRWPPALGQWPQLPAAILLELAPLPGGGSGQVIAQSILGPPQPVDAPYEYAPL